MNRQEAARYARWAAGATIAIVVLVAGVYLHRRMSGRVGRQELPPPVPASVEQQSAQFTYSKMIGTRALFTVHASRATEYKDQKRSLLQEVLITIFGRAGDRNDTISARECSYLPATEQIRCQGAVQIDLRDASPDGKVGSSKMHLETRDISFNHDGEEVSTPSDVKLEFAGGQGQGTGVVYDTKTETVRLLHNVQLQIEKSGSHHSAPAAVSAASLEYQRRVGLVKLSGSVRAQQDGRTLTSRNLELTLDSNMHPSRANATGRVRITDPTLGGAPSLAAQRVEVTLGAADEIQDVIADGDIHAQQKVPGGTESFSAQHAELMLTSSDGESRPHDLFAKGNVQANFQQDGVSRHLVTEGLHLQFVSNVGRRGVKLSNAETTAPGELEESQQGEADHMRAGKLTAEFNPQSQLAKLMGASGVQFSRQIGTGEPQQTVAQDLTAIFAGAKGWDTLEESGGVKFQQGDRTAQADRAVLTRTTNQMILDGSARVSDSASSTSAAHLEIDQNTGAAQASGSVISSYFSASGNPSLTPSSEAIHISADRLEASNSVGHAIYSGHARMWRGDSVIDADTIEIWRDQKKLEARGNVTGVFPQRPSRVNNSGPQTKSKTSGPVLWQIRAPLLDYWSDAGRVEMSGGVQAQSGSGAMSSQTLQLALEKSAKNQRVERATAVGNVRIEQDGRVGTASQAVYLPDGGEFVLSGGTPTLADASGNTTTGRELTFFLANDRIVVDSQKGSRTITKHRVEK
jgi:lipopolysaccharide export system protein LptA